MLVYGAVYRLYSLAVLRPGGENEGITSATQSLKGPEEGFPASLASLVSVHSLACGYIALISDSVSVFSSLPLSCLIAPPTA